MRGHPRSGTNWVSNLINLHPRVCCTGEFHLETIYNAVNRTIEVPWHLGGGGGGGREGLEEAFRDMLRRCIVTACGERARGALWLGDRTPSDLLFWMPDARYIWILRDGRDVAVSWTFHQLRKGPEVIERSIPPEAREGLLRLSRQFLANPDMFERQPELLLADEAWVHHVAGTWDRRFRSDTGAACHMDRPDVPARVLRVRYEELHADTEGHLRTMLRFLDLNPEEAEPASQQTHTTPGYQAANPLSYRRKGIVGDWKAYFTPQATAWFMQVAGESMRRAGYSP
ncbi:MAG: sulfotransferase domain-containing protein [Phycisphaerales bacterium]|nr:sulfotransferase domain-containing protein [Phycisphaerales bacterium]